MKTLWTLAVMLALGGCGGTPPPEGPAAAPIIPGLETAPVRTTALRDHVSLFATVSAEGEPPEVRDARAQVDEAEARLTLADEQVQRLAGLARGKVAPRRELEAAQAEQASAAAAARRARQVLASLGDGPTGPSLPGSERWVIAQVPQRELGHLTAPSHGQLALDALGGAGYAVTLDALPTYVATDTRTAPLRLRANDPDGRLRPGMTGTVRLDVGTERQALTVPEEAVLYDGDLALVVEDVDGTMQPRAVRIGIARDGRVEVVSGLAPGVRVVTTGAASALSATRLPSEID